MLTSSQRKLALHEKVVVASWSGGIDSTGVVANLLQRGYAVTAVTFSIYGNEFGGREAKAREALWPKLEAIAWRNGGVFESTEVDAKWIWAFSADGVEIPRRNKHILDRLVLVEAATRHTTQVAMGEYIGADTWLVKDHVAQSDADARALQGYLYAEYGLGYRLFTLADFGESRYKADRLRLGWEVLGDGMALTTVCLRNGDVHCGECYKCVERRAAFVTAELRDFTDYAVEPDKHPDYEMYLRQMRGELLNAPAKDFTMAGLPTS